MEKVLNELNLQCEQQVSKITQYYDDLKNTTKKTLDSLDYFNLPEKKEIKLIVLCKSYKLLYPEDLSSMKSDITEKILNCIKYESSRWKDAFTGKKEIQINGFKFNNYDIELNVTLTIYLPEIVYMNMGHFVNKVNNYNNYKFRQIDYYNDEYDEMLNMINISAK